MSAAESERAMCSMNPDVEHCLTADWPQPGGTRGRGRMAGKGAMCPEGCRSW